MKRRLTATPTQAAIAALLLCAVVGAAQAEQPYEQPVTAAAAGLEEQAAARPVLERRQNMIDDCEQNHGIDCEREVDTELRAEGLQWRTRVSAVHQRK